VRQGHFERRRGERHFRDGPGAEREHDRRRSTGDCLRGSGERQRGWGTAPPKCPPGLTGNPVPAFCIKLPSSYHVKDARLTPEKGSIAYDTGTLTDNLMISYDSTSIAQQTTDVTGEMKFGGDKLEKNGDMPGGNKWFQGSHQDYERIVTLLKGPAPLTFKCSFTYKPKSPPPKEAIDACKSIVLP